MVISIKYANSLAQLSIWFLSHPDIESVLTFEYVLQAPDSVGGTVTMAAKVKNKPNQLWSTQPNRNGKTKEQPNVGYGYWVGWKWSCGSVVIHRGLSEIITHRALENV